MKKMAESRLRMGGQYRLRCDEGEIHTASFKSRNVSFWIDLRGYAYLKTTICITPMILNPTGVQNLSITLPLHRKDSPSNTVINSTNNPCISHHHDRQPARLTHPNQRRNTTQDLKTLQMQLIRILVIFQKETCNPETKCG